MLLVVGRHEAVAAGPVAVLHTESSERERMKRDTLPVPERAASISVPAKSAGL